MCCRCKHSKTPSSTWPFDHSWTPFQKTVYSYRPEMIILPNWSDRCLHCCVLGHFSNSCPIPQYPKKDLCMQCHVQSGPQQQHRTGTSMEHWTCMVYAAPAPGSATSNLKPKTALDAYYDQQKQEEEFFHQTSMFLLQPINIWPPKSPMPSPKTDSQLPNIN